MLPPDEQPVQPTHDGSRVLVPQGTGASDLMPRSAEYDSSLSNGFAGSPAPPEILTNPFDANWVWHSFRRRWVLATGLGLLVGTALAATAWMLTPKKFTASTIIEVASSRPHTVFELNWGGGERSVAYELFQGNQVQLIKTPLVLTAAVRDPKVVSQPGMSKISGDEQIPWLANRLDVIFLPDSQFLSISITGDESEEELLTYVKAVKEAYMEEAVGKDRLERTAIKNSLRKAKDEISQTIAEKTEAYLAEVQSLNAHSSDTAAVSKELMLDEIGALRRQLSDYSKQLALVRMKYESDRRALRDPTLIAQSDTQRMETDPFLQQLLYEQVALEYQLAKQQNSQSSGRSAGQAGGVQSQLNQTAQMIEQRKAELSLQYEAQRSKDPNAVLRIVKGAYDTQKGFLDDQIAALREEMEKVEDAAKKIGLRDAKLEMTAAELEHLREVEKEMAVRLQQWEIESRPGAPERIRVVQQPQVLPGLGTVQRYAIVSAAGMFGFLLTCFGIAYLEFRFRRLNGPQQVDEGLGIRVVGALPSLAFRSTSRDGSDPLLTLLMESVDNVRTALMHDASSRNHRIVMVTSASGHEGRTTVASQLAASLARAGRRTLLVDGDLRHPSLHALFDVALEEGLCEVLRAEIDVDDAVRPTHAEGLWLLTAGFCDVNAIQAMARDQLQPIFDKLREQYDFVIIDAPPVLHLSDSLILGQYVDGAVISVLRDYSKVPQIHQANARLRDMGIRVLGAVVNGVRTQSNERTERLRLVTSAPAEAAPVEVSTQA